MDTHILRQKMVEDQLKSRGINDGKVISAFLEIPREYFISQNNKNEAYLDTPLPIGEGQTISQPYTTAFMTKLLELKGDEKVLEIGTGSGYSSAILSKLCKKVYSIEIIPILADKAKDVLKRLNIANVEVKVSDGSVGLRQYAPYDAIVVTAAAPEVPALLISQLKMGGKLVVPVGNSILQQMLKVIKTESGIKIESHGGFRFVPLVGKFGWKGKGNALGKGPILKEKS